MIASHAEGRLVKTQVAEIILLLLGVTTIK
jgi:hypothetical protein